MGLHLHRIFHAYGRDEVVRGIDLAVHPGEVACLLGPSGCGKTTLLRLAAGLEVLQRGEVRIGGRLVADGASGRFVPPERRNVGLMFQDYALFPHLTVFENVAFGLGRRAAQRREWVHRALRQVGLADLAAKYPHTLSGGEQQRCALLRALAPQPDVLLLDEPFSGMDVTRRAQVREETLVILRESGVATLIVTHDPEEAMFMADRLWIMNAGVIVQHGPPEEIYLHPCNIFVAGLFGPLNRIDGIVGGGRLDTPVGSFAAKGLLDGSAAAAFIRPEGLRIGAAVNGAAGTVLSARLLGRSSHLRVKLKGVAAPLQALAPGIFLPPPGQAVKVDVDRAHAFVFPVGKSSSPSRQPA
jgi:iron(III) transport system ATP-binding protein